MLISGLLPQPSWSHIRLARAHVGPQDAQPSMYMHIVSERDGMYNGHGCSPGS